MSVSFAFEIGVAENENIAYVYEGMPVYNDIFFRSQVDLPDFPSVEAREKFIKNLPDINWEVKIYNDDTNELINTITGQALTPVRDANGSGFTPVFRDPDIDRPDDDIYTGDRILRYELSSNVSGSVPDSNTSLIYYSEQIEDDAPPYNIAFRSVQNRQEAFKLYVTEGADNPVAVKALYNASPGESQGNTISERKEDYQARLDKLLEIEGGLPWQVFVSKNFEDIDTFGGVLPVGPLQDNDELEAILGYANFENDDLVDSGDQQIWTLAVADYAGHISESISERAAATFNLPNQLKVIYQDNDANYDVTIDIANTLPDNIKLNPNGTSALSRLSEEIEFTFDRGITRAWYNEKATFLIKDSLDNIVYSQDIAFTNFLQDFDIEPADEMLRQEISIMPIRDLGDNPSGEYNWELELNLPEGRGWDNFGEPLTGVIDINTTFEPNKKIVIVEEANGIFALANTPETTPSPTPTPSPSPVATTATPTPTAEPAPDPNPSSAPTLEPTPTKEVSNDQVQSIDDITTPDEVSTFKLREPIAVGKQEVETLIVGTDKKDRITGSSDGEILAGGKGKNILQGEDGADGFLFQDPDGFGKRGADKVKDFDPDEGDSILVDKDVFDLGKKIKLKVAPGKKASKNASNSKENFIYDNKKGLLYFNENGKEDGWGDGGLFVKLKGVPELLASDFTIV